MSGPNPPDGKPGDQPPDQPTEEYRGDLTGDTGTHSQAYSAPESEHYTSAPYVPADPSLYDYDTYEPYDAATELVPDAEVIEELLRAFTAGRSNRSRSRTAGLPRESRPHRTRTTFVATREVSPTTYLPI